MKEVICINCSDFVDYVIREEKDISTIKGKKIEYLKKVAYCKKCGEEVSVDEIDDYNAIAPIIEYCKENGLITIKQIEEILERYQIGKKPLSLLLDWGEITVSRFLAGQIPSKIYSDKLMELYNNPFNYLLLLESNRKKITNVAYNKSKRRMQEIIYRICLPKPQNYGYHYYKIGYSNNSYGGNLCKKQLLYC